MRFVDDRALVEGIRAGNPTAMTEFHDRFALRIQRILWGILGPDEDLRDLHHDVFVRALDSIRRLEDSEALSAWMTAIAVNTARNCLEKRISRRRWMRPASGDVVPEQRSPDPHARLRAREVLRALHTLLDQLPVAERVVFALRHLEGLELADVAEACEASLATVKRRLMRAEARVALLAKRSPMLVDELDKGESRWPRRSAKP